MIMTHASARREVLFQQLFLLNANLNNAILRTRDECVQVWELQLVGMELGRIYSLPELQASYKAAAKVTSLDKDPNAVQNGLLQHTLHHKQLPTASLNMSWSKSWPDCHPYPSTCIVRARLQCQSCIDATSLDRLSTYLLCLLMCCELLVPLAKAESASIVTLTA